MRTVLALLDQAGVAGVALDPDRRVVVWTAGMEALFGHPAEEALGRDASEFGVTPVEVVELADTILRGEAWEGDFRVRTPDGERLGYFRSRPVLGPGGDVVGLASVGADSDATHRAAQEAGLLNALFSSTPLGLGVFDAELRFVRVNPALEALIGTPAAALAGQPLDRALPGLAAIVPQSMRQVLATGEPIVGIEVGSRFQPGLGTERVCRYSLYALPDRTGRPAWVGCIVVDVTEQWRARAASHAATKRLALLSEASRLVGTSLDLTVTLEGLAKLAVPAFADHCVLDLAEVGEDGPEGTWAEVPAGGWPLRRATTTHRIGTEPRDPAALPEAGAPIRYPAAHPVNRVLASRKGVLWDRIDPALLDLAPMPSGAAFARAVGMRSAVFVPLIHSGEVLGVATFAASVSGRTYDTDDLTLAEEIAARAATAVANARAYHRERVAALTLQRNLLPREIDPVEGLDVAWRYEPGGAGARVGGDWFDVIPLGAGRVALTVGDVMGRGVAAAAVMGQLRAATRGLAALDLLPADVLTHLESVMAGTPEAQLATCLYAVYDPADGTLELANAGHPPPILRGPDGVRRLALDPALPIGVGGARFTSTRLTLEPGTVVALYTDGLIETRDADLDRGMARLETALAGMPEDLSAAADHVCGTALPAGAGEDDIALLLVRTTAVDPAGTVAVALPGAPRAAALARAATVDALRRWSLDHLRDTAELLVSELVTNTLLHADGPVELVVRRGRRTLFVQVADADARRPRVGDARPTDEHGRGLQLVDHLATRWGTRPTPDGKVVWFELSL